MLYLDHYINFMQFLDLLIMEQFSCLQLFAGNDAD